MLRITGALVLAGVAFAAPAFAADAPAEIKIGTLYASSGVGSSRVDLQACKLEYSIVSPK